MSKIVQTIDQKLATNFSKEDVRKGIFDYELLDCGTNIRRVGNQSVPHLPQASHAHATKKA